MDLLLRGKFTQILVLNCIFKQFMFCLTMMSNENCNFKNNWVIHITQIMNNDSKKVTVRQLEKSVANMRQGQNLIQLIRQNSFG